jgi:hypothetical protein
MEAVAMNYSVCLNNVFRVRSVSEGLLVTDTSD